MLANTITWRRSRICAGPLTVLRNWKNGSSGENMLLTGLRRRRTISWSARRTVWTNCLKNRDNINNMSVVYYFTDVRVALGINAYVVLLVLSRELFEDIFWSPQVWRHDVLNLACRDFLPSFFCVFFTSLRRTFALVSTTFYPAIMWWFCCYYSLRLQGNRVACYDEFFVRMVHSCFEWTYFIVPCVSCACPFLYIDKTWSQSGWTALFWYKFHEKIVHESRRNIFRWKFLVISTRQPCRVAVARGLLSCHSPPWIATIAFLTWLKRSNHTIFVGGWYFDVSRLLLWRDDIYRLLRHNISTKCHTLCFEIGSSLLFSFQFLR